MNPEIQSLRVELHKRLLELALLGNTREVNLARTAVQQARMLLGKVLGLLGEATPYPQADNPASAEIAPRADVAEYVPELPGDAVADFKTVRAVLEVNLAHCTALRRRLWARYYDTEAEILYARAYSDLVLAKMWLGEGLARLAEKKAPAA